MAPDEMIHWNLLMNYSFLITTVQVLLFINNRKIKRLKVVYSLAQKATFE